MKKMTTMTSTEKGTVTSNDLDKTNVLNDFVLIVFVLLLGRPSFSELLIVIKHKNFVPIRK